MSKTPKGVAEQRKKDILQELRKLGKDAYDAIVEGRFPEITLPSRSVNNLVYDEKLKQYILGSNSVKRSSRNVKHIRPYTQLLWLAFFANQLVSEDRTSTLRDVFYSAQAFNMEFTDQSESDEIITDLETALMKAREDFNVYPDERSAIFGNMIIEYTKPGYEGKRQDLSSHPDGLMIGPALTTAEFVETDAEMVIAIEKGGLFTRFVEEKVHQRFKALLINTAGQPPRSTRYVIRRLNQELGLPVYLLADADPWGAHICMVIKSGSANAAHLRELTTPSAKWLGVYASVPGDEPVVVEIDGLIRNEEIGELYSRYSGFATGSCYQQKHLPTYERLKALCCADSLETGVMPVDIISKHSYDGNLYEIRTALGFTVKATANHSIQIYNPKTRKLEPREVSCVKRGELMATPVTFPNNQSLRILNVAKLILSELHEEAGNIFVKEETNLGILGYGVQGSSGRTLDSYSGRSVPDRGILVHATSGSVLPVAVNLDRSIGRFLGLVVGNLVTFQGVGTGSLDFESVDDNLSKEIETFLIRTFDLNTSVSTEGNLRRISVHNLLFSLLFERLFGIRNNLEVSRIPFILFNVPDEIKAEFLAACTSPEREDPKSEKRGFIFRTKSKRLAADMILLTRQLGILMKLDNEGEFFVLRSVCDEGNTPGYNRTEVSYPEMERDSSVSMVEGRGPSQALKVTRTTMSRPNLEAGMVLLPIESVVRLGPCQGPVYDIEVDEVHTFMGGTGGLVLHNSDIQRYNLPHDKLTDLDIKRVHELQKDPRYEEKLWKDELECFLKYKRKAEQEAFSRYGLTYIVDKYLVDKLEQAKSM